MGPADRAAVEAALDRRLDPQSRAPLALGLSGGSDSLALLLCARDWAARHGRPLLALTLDHRLDPDSERWTAQAGRTARRLGAQWRALAWDGPKPSAGLPAAARRARHALLAEAAREGGARVLLVGHTADDMAESGLIRRETPSHGHLAEWAPSPVWPEGRGVFLLRPLLTVRRTALRAVLEAEGITWLEDPANSDPRYARSRARRTLALLLEGAGSGGGARAAGEAAGAGGGAASYGHPFVAGPHPQTCPSPFEGEGSCPEGVIVVARDAAVRHLAKALLCVGGGERPPPGAAVVRLLDRLRGGAALATTLAGARIDARPDAVWLSRELGRQPPAAVPLPPGEAVVFDGRFEVVAAEPGWRVAPLAGHAAALPKAEREALRALAAAARPSLPVLLAPDGAPRLPAPFGPAPAATRPLVGERLRAALGLIGDERALSAVSGAGAHGARLPALLSFHARE